MLTRNYDIQDAERLMPLLRAIRRELRERTLKTAELESRLTDLSEDRQANAKQIQRLESELSTQLRETRRVEKELGELGCTVDEDRPLRILIPSEDGQLACDGDLAKTRIHRIPENMRVR